MPTPPSSPIKPPHIYGQPEEQKRFAELLALSDELEQAPLQAINRQAARYLAQQQDDLIRIAISTRLGRKDWTLGEVVPRMQAIRYSWTEATLYLFDRMPLIALWPPESSTTAKDGTHMLNWHIPYRTYEK